MLEGLVDPDAPVLGVPSTDGGQPRGDDWLRRLAGTYRPYFRDFAVRPLEITSGGERVMVHLRIGGVGLSGAELFHDCFHVHTVRAGRSVRIEVFEDAAEATRAAGLDRA